MALLMTSYAVIFPALVGAGLVNLFLYKKTDASLLERLALGFCIGLMLVTLEMAFLLTKLNIPFSIFSISLPLVPILLAGLYVTIKNKLIDLDLSGLKGLKLLEILLIALILLKIFFIFSSLMIKPVSGWDAWANYSFRAKAYFMERTANVPSLPPTVRGQHDPLSQTWVFVCINDWNDILGKITFPFYYLALALLFYGAVRRHRDRLVSLFATYLLISLPFLVYHATIEYCDFMLCVYLFAGVSLLFLWLNDPQLRYLLLSFVFLLATTAIKSEAYFHLVIVISVFVITIFSSRLNRAFGIKWVRSLSIASVVLGGLYMIRMIFFAQHEALRFNAVDPSRISPLLSVFADYIFTRDNWNIIWPMLIILMIFNYKKLFEGFNLFLLGIVALEFSGFMTYYFLSQSDIYGWLFYVTPAVRNMLQFMPVAMLLFANLLTIDLPRLASAPSIPAKIAKKR
jgi:hypothetical protein